MNIRKSLLSALLAVTSITSCKTAMEKSETSDVSATRERLVCTGTWLCKDPPDQGSLRRAIVFKPADPSARPDPAKCSQLLAEELKRREPCPGATVLPESVKSSFESFEIQLISPGSGLGARLDKIISATSSAMRAGCEGFGDCAAHIRSYENSARQLDGITLEMAASQEKGWECSAATEGVVSRFLREVCDGTYKGNDCAAWARARNALKVNGAAICRLNPAGFCPDYHCE